MRRLWLLAPLAWLLVPTLRHLFEANMGLHMLLQFPLLFAAGWAAAEWLPARVSEWLSRLDVHGLSSATMASCIAAYWMIPTALDLAVLDPNAALLKYLSWPLAGVLMAQGWSRLSAATAAFFQWNATWMLVTAGLLYHEAEARLCVSYVQDEQKVTGLGLVTWGVALGMQALVRLRVTRPLSGQRE